MIGQYSVLAADRKQSNLFTILIGKSFLKDITKIRLVSGIAFSGTGRASILNKIKSDFTTIINKSPQELLVDDKLKYFNKISDFKGLNFVVSLQLSTGEYLHKFYLQGKNSYYKHFELSNNRKTSNPFNIMVLQPADIDFDEALNYCINAFASSENESKETIVLKMKNIFKHYSKKSKFVSSDFDIVFQVDNKDEIPIIINVTN
jgi:hypothetical protein